MIIIRGGFMEDILWDLFKQTGNINYYLLACRLKAK